MAVSKNGKKLVVTNYENDSISVLTKAMGVWTLTSELDLRPGVINPAQTSVPGGEFPFWVQIKGNKTAYISSIRDREIDVVDISGAPTVTARIKVPGQPNKMLLNEEQSRLFVAQDNSDSVAVINTDSNAVLAEIPVTAPSEFFRNRHGYKGANPNNLALSPDEKTLYVTNGGENAVAVIDLKKETLTTAAQAASFLPAGTPIPSPSVVTAKCSILSMARAQPARILFMRRLEPTSTSGSSPRLASRLCLPQSSSNCRSSRRKCLRTTTSFGVTLSRSAVNFVRTIEGVLGIPHLNLNDANAEPMSTVFDLHQKQ